MHSISGRSDKVPFDRRLRFAILVIISQLLLVVLALAWVVHMCLIAINGSIYFMEENSVILAAEIAVTILIMLFGTGVLVIQIKRLGARRRGDDEEKGSRR